jgi:hypothetical protein
MSLAYSYRELGGDWDGAPVTSVAAWILDQDGALLYDAPGLWIIDGGTAAGSTAPRGFHALNDVALQAFDDFMESLDDETRAVRNPLRDARQHREPFGEDDPEVIEISVNRPGHVYVERIGGDFMEHHEIPALTSTEIQNIGERVAAATSQFISKSAPLLSAALPSGERVQVVLPPAAPQGGAISIRKQVTSNFTLEQYRDNGSLDKVSVAVGGLSDVDRRLIDLLRAEKIYEFITTAIRSRKSILISGGTSSGSGRIARSSCGA